MHTDSGLDREVDNESILLRICGTRNRSVVFHVSIDEKRAKISERDSTGAAVDPQEGRVVLR